MIKKIFHEFLFLYLRSMKSTIIKNAMLIALGLGISLNTYAQVKKKTTVIPKNPVNVSSQNAVKPL